MIIAPYPQNEEARLRFLRRLDLLDTPAEEALDRMTRELAGRLQVPMALVTLVDANRQWFKSKVGLDTCQTSRDVSFCSHAIADDAMLIVEDALRDERFSDNPLVRAAPHVRFYAGVPLRSKEGLVMGTLCVLDTRPRQLDAAQRMLLNGLAKDVERYLFERHPAAGVDPHGAGEGTRAPGDDVVRGAFQAAPFGMGVVDAQGRLAAANRALCALLEQSQTAVLGSHASQIWEAETGAPLDLAAIAREGGFHQALLKHRSGARDRVWLHAGVGGREGAHASIAVTIVARDTDALPWRMHDR